MVKSKKYKAGQILEFNFAGSVHQGEVTSVDSDGKVKLFDGKYKYVVQSEKIIKVIK